MVKEQKTDELLLSTSRRYGNIVLSPNSHDIDPIVIESCNEIVQGVSTIDQLFTRWEDIPIDEKNVHDYLTDMNICSTIRTLCLGIASVERLIEDPKSDELLSVVDEQYICKGLRIQKERNITVGDVTYTGVQWSLQRNGEGFVLQKTAYPRTAEGRLDIFRQREPIQIDYFRQELVDRLDETLKEVKQTYGIDYDLSSSDTQIFRSQRDVDFFRTKLDIIFHDYGNPLQLTEGYFALFDELPTVQIVQAMRSLDISSTSGEIVELSHQLIHAHEENVTTASLRIGLKEFAQAAYDRECIRKGFSQQGIINVEDGVFVYDPDLNILDNVKDGDIPEFVFSHVFFTDYY